MRVFGPIVLGMVLAAFLGCSGKGPQVRFADQRVRFRVPDGWSLVEKTDTGEMGPRCVLQQSDASTPCPTIVVWVGEKGQAAAKEVGAHFGQFAAWNAVCKSTGRPFVPDGLKLEADIELPIASMLGSDTARKTPFFGVKFRNAGVLAAMTNISKAEHPGVIFALAAETQDEMDRAKTTCELLIEEITKNRG